MSSAGETSTSPLTVTPTSRGRLRAIAAVGAYLNRRASLDRLFALGLVATMLGATYWHVQDISILVVAAWLFWRGRPPAWQRWWLLVVAIAGEFAWPLTPLAILVGVAVWFACLVVPRRATPETVLRPASA